jgi:hypothetical protein
LLGAFKRCQPECARNLRERERDERGREGGREREREREREAEREGGRESKYRRPSLYIFCQHVHAEKFLKMEGMLTSALSAARRRTYETRKTPRY